MNSNLIDPSVYRAQFKSAACFVSQLYFQSDTKSARLIIGCYIEGNYFYGFMRGGEPRLIISSEIRPVFLIKFFTLPSIKNFVYGRRAGSDIYEYFCRKFRKIFDFQNFDTTTIMVSNHYCSFKGGIKHNLQSWQSVTNDKVCLACLLTYLFVKLRNSQCRCDQRSNRTRPSAKGAQPLTEASRPIPVINIAKPIPTKHKDALNGEHQKYSAQKTKCHHDGMVFKSLHYAPPRPPLWSVLHHTFKMKSMGLAA